jgi:hypothetical protein
MYVVFLNNFSCTFFIDNNNINDNLFSFLPTRAPHILDLRYGNINNKLSYSY